MSKSQIACVIESGTATVVRLKSSGLPGYTMTVCRTLRTGLAALTGPKAKKNLDKLSGFLREWKNEPVALSFSPSEFHPLPAWFPASAAAEYHEALCRIEAGYFLKNPDQWNWQQFNYEPAPGQAPFIEKKLLLFYQADPCRFIEQQLQKQYSISCKGLHFASFVHLSTFTATPQLILEIEEHYVAFLAAWNGKIEYFRYWPVKSGSEREYFCIRELMAYPLSRSSVINVTGSAADQSLLKHVSRETTCKLEPLGIPESISISDSMKRGKPSFAAVKAISTALMALHAGQD